MGVQLYLSKLGSHSSTGAHPFPGTLTLTQTLTR